ncbi:MAG TPA: SpoIIE family protein phosphatase [Actinocrinis sp.]|nr:SpoIIE family protein phosphatase [Actinocrinis sp.]
MAGQLIEPRLPQRVGKRRDPGAVRPSLLSRAGMLLGTSLDTGRTLAAIAELVVPSFADQCVVDLIDDSGRLNRAVTVRMDQAKGRRTSPVGGRGRQVQYPSNHPCAVALRTLRPAIADLSSFPVPLGVPGPGGPAPATPGAPGPVDGQALLEEPVSIIAVPLLGPRGVKGVLAAAIDAKADRFDSGDVALLEEVAARAGFALENAALYENMRTVALALQHSLLPTHLPEMDGVKVQFRYSPGDDSDVGGDLYDVIELSAGRIGVAIGDVQGRGAHAAAVMGQLRAALRAYAVLDLEPADVLGHLDELVLGLNEALLVTCIYAVYDPFTRQCVLANAGHPPPLLAGAHGCSPMEVPPDVPLGVGGVAFNDHTFVVAPGDAIVLYTDGVVERRDRAVDLGVRELCEALEKLGEADDPNALCRVVLRTAGSASDDDQAVLAMSTGFAPLPIQRTELPVDPQSASMARSYVTGILSDWDIRSESVVDTVELLVSELVTNAVRHAAGPSPVPRVTLDADESQLDLDALERALLADTPPENLLDNVLLDGAIPKLRMARRIEVVVRRGQAAIWIEVYDQDVRTPRVRSASATDEGGRGLFLVKQLSQRWGVRSTTTGKAVWFQLALPEEDRAKD